MQAKGLSSEVVEFRSIEEPQLAVIHGYQNGEIRQELSSFLDLEMPWAPSSLSQIRAKIEEIQKEDRTVLFCIWSKANRFIGLGRFSAEWDTWCPHFGIIIWPEYRRKGYGAETAKLILDAAFNQGMAHVIGGGAPEWATDGIAFAEFLGFKRSGAIRRAGVIGGKFYDLAFFDMLRSEYLERHSKGKK